MIIGTANFLPTANANIGEKYLLLECLGDGSHGWVWRAERLNDNEVVAIKIPKQLSKDDRSLSEGRELIGITSHPNVIQINYVGRVPPDNHYFVIEMEYFPSESLAQKLEHRSHHFGNTYERLFHMYEQVLEAVAYLANIETPISHGDIKPHNILVGLDDLVKLTDFGSSALPEEIYVRTRENGGTVLYSAPEFSDCVSRKGTFRQLIQGDIYSLGVLLYQLITCRLPHDTQAQVRSHAPFPKPREINKSIAPELEKIILRCLQKEPDNRYESIDILIEEFLVARKVQQNYVPILPDIIRRESTKDWSSDVVAALENGNYIQAAQVAKVEFKRSQDLGALLQQLNSLYRAERWFDLEKELREINDVFVKKGDDAFQIRLLAIKTYMQLRQLEKAETILKKSFEFDQQTLEHTLIDASIKGMKADFGNAKKQLVLLNQEYPRNPNILRRLVQVSEQLRDYSSASGYLRVLLKVCGNDDSLSKKRHQYEMLGVW